MPHSNHTRDRLDLDALLWAAVHQPAPIRQRTLAVIRHPALAAAAAQRMVERQVEAVHARGWNPAEVLHVARRRTGGPHVVAILTAALIAVHARLPQADRRWAVQVDDLADGGTAARTATATIPAALDAVALLTRLPELPTAPEETVPPAADDRTATLLDRVRALLRKAESTTFEAEADALTAKAQQLITRHAIDAALLDPSAGAAGDGPIVRRILLDDPYLRAKSLLVHVVAEANRCRSVASTGFGWCTVVGHAADVAACQLLVASLLAQAVAAMSRTGSRRDAHGRVRTRSFRRTFLEAYAVRIGDRLAEAATDEIEAHAEADRLLPVLAARTAAVDEAVDRFIGRTTLMRGRPLDPDGWAAGTAAADLADLDTSAGRIARRSA